MPNLKGAAGAAVWVNDTLGIPVTARYITHQTNTRALESALIMGCRYYSTRALYTFIMSKTRPATGVTA